MLEVRHKSESRFELAEVEKKKRPHTSITHFERPCLPFSVMDLEDNRPSEPGRLGLFCLLSC